jgi:hypothetical protein
MSKPITLDTPIKRGDATITEITLNKPASGALRGVALVPLLQMDVNALALVLPRISTPTLTAQEVLALDPADLLQLSTEVTNFLLPKSALADSPTM